MINQLIDSVSIAEMRHELRLTHLKMKRSRKSDIEAIRCGSIYHRRNRYTASLVKRMSQ